MKITQTNSFNFKAQVNLDKRYSLEYFFENIKKDIENSGTSNIYDVKKVQGSSKYYQILLNEEKFKNNLVTKTDGEYTFLKNIFNSILEKEKTIIANKKGTTLNTQLDMIKKYAQKIGISVEDIKKFL